MKKAVSLFLALALSCSMFAGCNSAVTGSSTSSDASSAASEQESSAAESTADESEAASSSEEYTDLSGSLRLTGSTSMQEVCEKLGEAFMAKYPDVTFEKGGAGSGEAPTAVTEGTANIGDLSRELKDDENPDQFTAVTIALDGIAVIVNKDSQVENLTQDQIKQIFTGEITNWSEVGGADGTIKVIGREAASGTRDGFESILGIKDETVYSVEQNATGAVISAVASDPTAIGYVSLANVENTQENIKAVSVDDVAPSVDTVADGSYVLQRPFVQIFKKGSTDELVMAWFDFLASDEGQQIIEEEGLVPQEINIQ